MKEPERRRSQLFPPAQPNCDIQVYSRIDVLVYNSGAIWWGPVATTPMKRFQLMQRVNVEGLYGVVQEALPHLKARAAEGADENRGSGRIIVVCPPIYSRFFRGKTAYAVGKVGMSVLVKGLGMDFEREGLVEKGLAITGLWPAVVSLSPHLFPCPFFFLISFSCFPVIPPLALVCILIL